MVVDVSLGADMTAMSEAKEWIEAKEKGEKKTTSCCPAFKNYIEKHFPTLKDAISETVSPMCAVSRYIKEKFPGAVTIYRTMYCEESRIHVRRKGYCGLCTDLW